jgi:threonylcarbamoyladenosine tRNA methylthiotransferase MtaB
VRVHLRTFGCRANQYDTEAVRGMIEAAGGEIAERAIDADVAVINSCAVTAEAVADLRQHVRRAAREAPALRTVVMGCASALDDGTIAALPGVSHVLAGADLAGVARALALPPSAIVADATRQAGARALLRIQDGCDAHCTFCATVRARGANRSRAADTLVAEASRLAVWHPEIVLTGIHIGHYGADSGTTLSALVERLVREVPVVRFRLSSLEATEVDDRLRELFGDPARLAPHLHAPLQSGSDRVLRRMGRHWYTRDAYARAVERLVAGRHPFALGADVIAGFPGETEEDHAATVALARDLPFTYLHVFPYSPRPGSASTRLDGTVPPAVAAARARELRAIGAARAAAHRAARLGGRCDLVVTGEGVRRAGVTEDYLDVRLDAALPRGTRCEARLHGDADRLLATPTGVTFPA